MVVLNRVNGYEYAVEGEDGSLKFSDRVLFENLKPGKTYKFYQRFKATATHDAGTTSEALIIKTDQRVSVESVQLDKTVLVLEKGRRRHWLQRYFLPMQQIRPTPLNRVILRWRLSTGMEW